MTGRTLRKGALLDSGTPSPNPWDLSLSRQNVCSTRKALERRIGLRRDATRAQIQGPEWQGAGFHSRPQNSNPRPRRALAYCGQKMVLTMGSTLLLAPFFSGIPDSEASSWRPEQRAAECVLRRISPRLRLVARGALF